MRLHDYLSTLSTQEKNDFAKRCGTSLGFLRLVAGAFRPCSPELAVNIDRESGGKVKAENSCPSPKIDWVYLAEKFSLQQGHVNQCSASNPN
jgi:DNA-binding transcriptional regulator YdaS (Cro superfamily)